MSARARGARTHPRQGCAPSTAATLSASAGEASSTTRPARVVSSGSAPTGSTRPSSAIPADTASPCGAPTGGVPSGCATTRTAGSGGAMPRVLARSRIAPCEACRPMRRSSRNARRALSRSASSRWAVSAWPTARLSEIWSIEVSQSSPRANTSAASSPSAPCSETARTAATDPTRCARTTAPIERPSAARERPMPRSRSTSSGGSRVSPATHSSIDRDTSHPVIARTSSSCDPCSAR
ncbi:hypothetical protein Q8A49_11735 [Nocardiopsis umidischolae]|uniref:Uncharacterized protein n=1 Tax=Nocardiopsis tropica TaxID=109330 RepID=A0ABU7KPD8_9ACTN|nr:hypothetical protein [Nocardiopsis umidischolae]